MASTPIKPTFDAEDIPAFKVGEYKSVDLQPTGGTPPYSCDVTQGDLPAGLSFSKDGTLSGTAQRPNDPAPPTVWFRVTDSFGLQGTRAYPITVLPRT
ncbi:MAG TPA: putative Ig domain-containing protein [Pyrinomonadaceae bacterium]|nr:putative Ig domain-containing protein [Pyrinomonadaceae bacterium]